MSLLRAARLRLPINLADLDVGACIPARFRRILTAISNSPRFGQAQKLCGDPLAPKTRKRRNLVKRSTLTLFLILTLTFAAPALAQRAHPGGGPPAGRGAGSDPGISGSHTTTGGDRGDISHGSPNEVLSHNTAIVGKIKSLTGQDAQTACSGFKNIGQCVAAAHVAKNLDIPGGFAALKAKMTGSGSVSLGKAISELSPNSDGKAEAKKAKKQADDDLNETSS
jgi:hypothetical protein